MSNNNNNNNNIDAVFFDLDGTLCDTAADLANACNTLLNAYEGRTVPLEQFRLYVPGGTKQMICESFGITDHHPQFMQLKHEFLTLYNRQLTRHTSLFPGVTELLEFLDQQGIPWGIVTGKNYRLAEEILNHFDLSKRYCCLVGGDTVHKVKPAPEPLLYACNLISSRPQNSFYIGDVSVDVQAANAAAMQSIAVTYGYRDSTDDPNHWNAKNVFDSCWDVADFFRSQLA